jgi:uncharacterized protein YaiI (UPF0178 family)
LNNILVDADACPVVSLIEELSLKYQIPTTYICDTSHQINLESDSKIIIVDKGSDSVDYKILALANSDSIIITQDYALASLCLTKEAKVIHTNAFMIDNDNIEQLLSSRYLNKKARLAKEKISNPKKRQEETNLKFKRILESIIKQ